MANLFDILKTMNKADAENGTANLAISNYCEGGKSHKKGAIIEMGVDASMLNEMMDNKRTFLLLCVDKQEYKKVEADLNEKAAQHREAAKQA